jgi:hypothetical protein
VAAGRIGKHSGRPAVRDKQGEDGAAVGRERGVKRDLGILGIFSLNRVQFQLLFYAPKSPDARIFFLPCQSRVYKLACHHWY